MFIPKVLNLSYNQDKSNLLKQPKPTLKYAGVFNHDNKPRNIKNPKIKNGLFLKFLFFNKTFINPYVDYSNSIFKKLPTVRKTLPYGKVSY